LNRVSFGALFISDGFDGTTAARVDAALGAVTPGFAAVQLRAPGSTGLSVYEAATTLRTITRAHGAQLLINDRVDVALAVDADGVHLPARGIAPTLVRRLGGTRLLIGVSTHAVDEARAAEHDGADYVVFGPVFFTPSKAHYGAPLGLDALAAAVHAVAVPLFALGGVDAESAPACVARGARVACIGAVLGRDDAAAGARTLEDAVKRS
jgi:thiamine-phosphate pyrophosphorylase